jgi:uncharacterized protein with FMN-binding domain
MSKRMPRRLVALSSSAIAAIYFAGFTATRAADAGMFNGANAVPTAVTDAAVTISATASPAATSTAVSAPTVTPYKDGAYSGTGTSRRGNVTVALTIAGGRITALNLTRVATEYPASAIASLPAQVVATQSAHVNGISGATYSAQAFSGAVQAALQQASQ